LYFCTSKASKLSTFVGLNAHAALSAHTHLVAIKLCSAAGVSVFILLYQ
jgi:hypothetical protein